MLKKVWRKSSIVKKPAREYAYCVDGNAKAHLIALARSDASERYDRWTLRLLRGSFCETGVCGERFA
jgi:hypothetical protein